MAPSSPSTPAIYAAAAAGCVIVPALGITTNSREVVWSYVLLAGTPLAAMAILLRVIHIRLDLTDPVYRTAALVWTTAALLILLPFTLTLEGGIARWARVGGTGLAGVVFARTIVHVARARVRGRGPLVLAFGAISIFFWFQALSYLSPGGSIGVEAAAAALSGFFLDAVVTCLLLLPALAAASRRNA